MMYYKKVTRHSIAVTVLLVTILCNKFVATISGEKTERSALHDLYKSFGGDDWFDQSEPDHCNWRGIDCVKGWIVGIEFDGGNFRSSYNLKGSIPNAIGIFTRLERLEVSYNYLTGSIPTQIGMLTKLESLKFSFNDLTGSIPTEIGMLTKLKVFNSSWNYHTGSIPTEIGRITNLEWSLWLSHNDLTGSIPTEIGMLTNLNRIEFWNNHLTGSIPSEIGMMTKLDEGLSLSVNDLTGSIPSEIGMLTNLETLLFENNTLTGSIPTDIGMLTNLKILHFQNNDLTGSIPSEIGMMTKLENLTLGLNYLTGSYPTEIGMLTNLKICSLMNKNLTGNIPSEENVLKSLFESVGGKGWYNRSKLEPKIYKSFTDPWPEHCKWSGIDCNFFGAIVKIDLSSKGLEGTIGTEIGLLTELKTLLMYNNVLSGDVPTELGMLSKLEVLNVGNNNLGGDLPNMMENLAQLQELNITNNNFYSDFKNMFPKKLKILDLSNNNRVAGILDLSTIEDPEVIVLSKKGDKIQLSQSFYNMQKDNWLSMKIFRAKNMYIEETFFPFLLSVMPNLVEISLLGSSDIGSFPESLPSLDKLEILRLYDCGVSGKIPAINFNSTKVLDLSYNRLTGAIPAELSIEGYAPLLEILDLSDNKLTGAIPAELAMEGYTPLLQILDLSNNTLTGTIPTELAMEGYAPLLQILDLSNNRLTGTIPTEFTIEGYAPLLQILDLSVNNLSGTIPLRLANIGSNSAEIGTVIRLAENKFNESFLAPYTACSLLGDRFDLSIDEMFCPAARKYLWNFFFESKGEIWTNSTNWNSEYESHCNWYGVICNMDNTTVTEINLHNNDLSGRLSPQILSISSLKVLNLNNNRIRGSIPSEIQNLVSLKELRLSYNFFNKAVPTELQQLSELSIIHLHGNRLTGKVIFDVKMAESNAFIAIADCGKPSDFPDEGSLRCANCTTCCNNLGECQKREKTKITYLGFEICETKENNKNLLSNCQVQKGIGFIGVIMCSCFVLAGISFVMKKYGISIFDKTTDAREIEKLMGDDSIYKFFCSSNIYGFIAATLIWLLQITLYFYFVQAAELNFTESKSEYIYKYRCSRNMKGDEKCEFTSNVDYFGRMFCLIVVFICLWKDLINGSKLLVKIPHFGFGIRKSMQITIGASAIVSLAAFAIYSSYTFNAATSTADVLLIMNSVVLIFLSDLDERFYEPLDNIFGIESLENIISNNNQHAVNSNNNADPTRESNNVFHCISVENDSSGFDDTRDNKIDTSSSVIGNSDSGTINVDANHQVVTNSANTGINNLNIHPLSDENDFECGPVAIDVTDIGSTKCSNESETIKDGIVANETCIIGTNSNDNNNAEDLENQKNSCTQEEYNSNENQIVTKGDIGPSLESLKEEIKELREIVSNTGNKVIQLTNLLLKQEKEGKETRDRLEITELNLRIVHSVDNIANDSENEASSNKDGSNNETNPIVTLNDKNNQIVLSDKEDSIARKPPSKPKKKKSRKKSRTRRKKK